MKKKYALISVFNKEKIEKICQTLLNHNINIIATGSTATYIKKSGYKCYSINYFTKFKEILDGRVKTLHPNIHASILFKRKNKKHIKEFKKLNFPEIDFVIVNPYPFQEMQNKSSDSNKIIEMIDIGGLALLRSAAKNFHYVSTICNINDYKEFIDILNKNNGKTNLNFRKKMAAKVFEITSNYDSMIGNWITNNKNNNFKIFSHKKVSLRYGENPHQSAFLCKDLTREPIFYDNIIKTGKGLSYNNILDIDSAYECINEFKEPTCVIIKHNNPCGVASNKNIINAFINALKTDSDSAFGGIIALNRNVDHNIAKKITSNFFEIIIAPKFNNKAKVILNKKKNLILIETKKILKNKKLDIKSINGGYLLQQKNTINFVKKDMRLMSNVKISNTIIKDLIFSFKVCKHVKSNAIVLVKNKKTIGIGAGQMSRIDATKIALSKLSKKEKKNGFVSASDAFFPFIDNIKILLKNNCVAIIQPKGSINDDKIIEFANKNNIALFFSKYRFFKH